MIVYETFAQRDATVLDKCSVANVCAKYQHNTNTLKHTHVDRDSEGKIIESKGPH